MQPCGTLLWNLDHGGVDGIWVSASHEHAWFMHCNPPGQWSFYAAPSICTQARHHPTHQILHAFFISQVAKRADCRAFDALLSLKNSIPSIPSLTTISIRRFRNFITERFWSKSMSEFTPKSVIAVGAVLPGLATIAVILRFYGRLFKASTVGVDDWMILCSLACETLSTHFNIADCLY